MLSEKTVVCTGKVISTEIQTGNVLYQIAFGQWIDSSPEVMN